VDNRSLHGRPGSLSSSDGPTLPWGQSPLVVVGSSTGGPAALVSVMRELGRGFPSPVVIVQHILPGYTASLARRLDAVSSLTVEEARQGQLLQPGLALLAPGGVHLALDSSGRVRFNRKPPRHGVRPSVDVVLDSAVDLFGGNVIAVILTGMGHDGAQGALRVKEHGGKVIAQDESTAVVYGMPKATVELGGANCVVPLESVPSHILLAVRSMTVKR